MSKGISRALVWSLLAAPLLVLTYNYVFETTLLTGEVYYGGYVHDTGRIAAWLLLAALLVTPLRQTFRSSSIVRWYGAQRRYLGVASFFYALAHLGAYLQHVFCSADEKQYLWFKSSLSVGKGGSNSMWPTNRGGTVMTRYCAQ